jgi:hypothetical protein
MYVVTSKDVANNSDTETESLLDAVPDETVGQIIKQAVSTGLGDLQNQGRIVVERLFKRNAIFAAKVQQNNRINIPQAEVEKLDIEPGEIVQVALTSVEDEAVDRN